ncbi:MULTISPECIES: ImmA/IrrE family metallo-endopeptidase [Paenibacillus]|uniref:IrrE N-terminal-like domain-containing protein n=1 Tax=Paenibacillus borealis TaxID=160799 RepID=A0ABX3H1X5_PAEBO|nr:ImmA/IrrE family metallo-endopeptidase [Paenibacillus borealis]OMD43896.1 hypothetical protein BSK56_23085 [Paenibacillus borealis]
MFIHYKKTHLEQFIEHIYLDHHITSPEQITIHDLSIKLNINVQYSPISSRAYESVSGMRCILLDSRISPIRQRFDFLHELCHMLRHVGNQIVLPNQFVKAQEEDAHKFVLYATMPYFMIRAYVLSDDYNQAIHQLSSIFGVPREMAKLRFDQILRREYEGELLSGRTLHNKFKKNPNTHSNHVKETKVLAYYDPYSNFDGPDQLIVCLDYKTLTTQYEIVIPMDERFQEIELEALNDIVVESTISGDLICFDGQLTLQVHQLVYRCGYSKRNFVLHMRDIVQLLETDRRSLEKFN